jgi:hypothetical protein
MNNHLLLYNTAVSHVMKEMRAMIAMVKVKRVKVERVKVKRVK